jgi:esterase/lipase superfamily enzyme
LGIADAPESIVNGTVTDKGTGTALSNVEIIFKASSYSRAALTDESGAFAVLLKPLQYEVTFRKDGYSSKVARLEIGTVTLSQQLVAVGDSGSLASEIRKPDYQVVRIFYATDRQAQTNSTGAVSYSAEYNANVSFGECLVSIPRDHKMGVVERPSLWDFEFREDRKKHLVLIGTTSLDDEEVFRRVKTRLDMASKRQILVFIHGFNVTFDEASLRTAQLQYDLGFDGATFLYSWPSRGGKWGSDGIAFYAADADRSDLSVKHLIAFLSSLKARANAESVHVIAHSMGNRALIAALEHMSSADPLVDEVMLAAPDYSIEKFLQVADDVKHVARRVTLYASSKDVALKTSRELHDGARLGEAGNRLLVLAGMDTVDASTVRTDFLSHSYFADSTSVIGDIKRIVEKGSRPKERGLKESFLHGLSLPFWSF